jgi:hypothetical protein
MRRPISVAMIPITTSSSINVNALRRAGLADMAGARPLRPRDTCRGDNVVFIETARFRETDRSGEMSFWAEESTLRCPARMGFESYLGLLRGPATSLPSQA